MPYNTLMAVICFPTSLQGKLFLNLVVTVNQRILKHAFRLNLCKFCSNSFLLRNIANAAARNLYFKFKVLNISRPL
jgi:hypothetical protein